MKRLAVLTSGGDAPGMNAAIRAIAKLGAARGAEVVGVHDGYAGEFGGSTHPWVGTASWAGMWRSL